MVQDFSKEQLISLQKRTVKVLSLGQALGGFGLGATLSVGALLAVELSGTTAWSGAAATLSTLGSAAVAIPLANLAFRARPPCLLSLRSFFGNPRRCDDDFGHLHTIFSGRNCCAVIFGCRFSGIAAGPVSRRQTFQPANQREETYHWWSGPQLWVR